jgi:hypothetical protein
MSSSCHPAYVRIERDEYNTSETTDTRNKQQQQQQPTSQPLSIPPSAVPLNLNPYVQSN